MQEIEPTIEVDSYLTVEDIRQSRVESFKDLPDYFIQKRLNELSRVIDEHCNTKFEPTQIFWRTDIRSKVRTLKKPLLTVDEVRVSGETLIEDEDYYVYPERNTIEIEDTTKYPKKKKALDLKYTFGHEKVPALVKEALMELFKDSVSTLNQNTGRIKSEQWEDYSYTLSDSSDVVRGILGRLNEFKEDDEPPERSNKVRAMLL